VELTKLNLGCGKDIRAGWTNVDRVALKGVNLSLDLFVYPWTGLNRYHKAVDEIYCGHLIEHVPHDGINNRDGFFCFFHECWKLLKPDGVMTVQVPYGKSTAALQDPTHTRYLVEASFTYLNPELYKSGDNFDYGLPFGFEIQEIGYLYYQDWVSKVQAQGEERFMGGFESLHLWNVVWGLNVILRPMYASKDNRSWATARDYASEGDNGSSPHAGQERVRADGH